MAVYVTINIHFSKQLSVVAGKSELDTANFCKQFTSTIVREDQVPYKVFRWKPAENSVSTSIVTLPIFKGADGDQDKQTLTVNAIMIKQFTTNLIRHRPDRKYQNLAVTQANRNLSLFFFRKESLSSQVLVTF